MNGCALGKLIWTQKLQPEVFSEPLSYGGHTEDGLRDGDGKCTYADGSTYKGQWKKGCRNGSGVWESKQRRLRFEGTWICDKRHHGKWYEDGFLKYEGFWKNDMWHGEGKQYETHDGNTQVVFEGTFEEGVREGPGFHLTGAFSTGAATSGVWKKGKLQGEVFEFADPMMNICFEGNYVDGVRHGFGTEYAPQRNSVFQGTWRHGKAHGYGLRISSPEIGSLTECGIWVQDVFSEGSIISRRKSFSCTHHVSDGNLGPIIYEFPDGSKLKERCKRTFIGQVMIDGFPVSGIFFRKECAHAKIKAWQDVADPSLLLSIHPRTSRWFQVSTEEKKYIYLADWTVEQVVSFLASWKQVPRQNFWQILGMIYAKRCNNAIDKLIQYVRNTQLE